MASPSGLVTAAAGPLLCQALALADTQRGPRADSLEKRLTNALASRIVQPHAPRVVMASRMKDDAGSLSTTLPTGTPSIHGVAGILRRDGLQMPGRGHEVSLARGAGACRMVS